jgi:hypothetical protein
LLIFSGIGFSFFGVIVPGFGRIVSWRGGFVMPEGGFVSSEIAFRPRKSHALQSLGAGVVQFCRLAQSSGL